MLVLTQWTRQIQSEWSSGCVSLELRRCEILCVCVSRGRFAVCSAEETHVSGVSSTAQHVTFELQTRTVIVNTSAFMG